MKFLLSQLKQIKHQGIEILISKSYTLIKKIYQSIILLCFFFIAFIPVMLVRLLKKIVIVRFGELESGAIGHFSWSTEVYLIEQKRGINYNKKKTIDFWYFNAKICNYFLKEKWKPFFNIIPKYIIKPIHTINQIIPGGDDHIVPYRQYQYKYGFFNLCKNNLKYQGYDIYNVTQNTKPIINFSIKEKKIGATALKKIGIAQDQNIVCFVNRDASYNKIDTNEECRNSSIESLIPGIHDLTKSDYKCIRMGRTASEIIKIKNTNIFDYANSNLGSDLLDFYLISKCKFFISTGTGLDAVACMFRKPVLIVNYPTFGLVTITSNIKLFIPKLFWSISKKRFLTFKEIFRMGAHLIRNDVDFKIKNIKIIDNDIEDVKQAILEMKKRMDGTWIESIEDIKLQKLFKSLWPDDPVTFGKIDPNFKIKLNKKIPLIGTHFLKKNKSLLN